MTRPGSVSSVTVGGGAGEEEEGRRGGSSVKELHRTSCLTRCRLECVWVVSTAARVLTSSRSHDARVTSLLGYRGYQSQGRGRW